MANETPLWYVIHTYSGYENKVADNIKKMVETRGMSDLIVETRIPLEIVEKTNDEETDEYEETSSTYDFDDESEEGAPKKKKKRAKKERKPDEHKLFPSYVLVKMVMNDETWHVVRNIRGCTGFVGPGSRPVPLTDKEVAALGVDIKVSTKRDYEVGDSVMVVAGFLAGAIATVKEIHDDTERIKVVASIDGREADVEMNMHDVEPVKD